MDHNFLKLDCSSIKESRLIYLEAPRLPEASGAGDVDANLHKLEGRSNLLAWRDRRAQDAVSNFQAGVSAGTESDHQPETTPNIDMTKAINPTPENMKYLLGELNKVFREVLPTQYGQLYAGATITRNAQFLRDMPRGFLMKAVTENGSPNALIKKFKEELGKIEDQANNVDLLLIPSNKLVDFFRWLVYMGTWDLAPKGNPNLDDTPNAPGQKTVKPHHKVFLQQGLGDLEKYYRERLVDKQGHLFGDNYDDDKMDYLDDTALPFYREFYLNQAILNKDSAAKLAEDYSQYLVKAYRDCIPDLMHRSAQETDDLNFEVSERNGSELYLNAVQSITGAVIEQ
jgi:hypothetical protein